MIWRMLLIATLAAGLAGGGAAATQAAEDGFVTIFDGKTLDNWDGNPAFWSVKDGAITGQTTAENPTKGNTFIVWRGGELQDFDLELEYRIVGGNSGIQYRSFEVPDNKWVVGGYQGDFEAGDTWSGANYGERFRGILAARGEKTVIGADHKPKVVGKVGDSAEIQKGIKKEDWNKYEISARGFHFVHKINGMLSADVTDEDKEQRREKGILALQLHAGPPMLVQFRNIKLKQVKPEAAPPGEKSGAIEGAKKKVVFIAGKPSHGYGSHEHYAGCVLLAKDLHAGMPNIETSVIQNGWPADAKALEGADCIVMYCDGGGGHMVNAHLDQVNALAKKGVGIVCIHYAVEVPKGASGEAFLNWIGGYFETNWSVNPHWDGDFKDLPKHAITSGVKPFKINDEWYYHMRFRPEMKGVTPILSALPPASSLSRPDGTHSGNPDVRKAVAAGEVQHCAWACEREDGGRGFGFTGGHVHWNWGDDNFRKLVLNAITWCAKADVPEGGVGSSTPSQTDLEANQDEPKPAEKKTSALPAKPAKAGTQAVAADTPAKTESRDPADAVAELDVAEGLEATLFASEAAKPGIQSVANLDVDAKGRVWVVEIMNYRHNNNSRPEGDRILILEDTDGDGVSDKTKVFYQGRDIDTALGIGVLGNKVIVSVAPNVFVFTDENGDDVPDKKEVFFTNVGQPQHDHSTHSFIFGPDGKLYWNVGNTGMKVCDKDGKQIVDLQGNEVIANGKPYYGGMPFRCNLDGSEFEVLGHNFRNNYETTVDSFGTLWQSDNDDDGNRGVRINYVMEFGNFGYLDEVTGAAWKTPRTNMEKEIPLQHWHLNDPGVVPNLVQTGAGSPTGITVYEGRLLPKPFWDQVIHTDAGPNVVRAYPAKKSGAGYTAEMLPILTGTRDKWFRPADVAVGPDGALYVTDWYDPGVGGHRQGDLDRGRVFRVAPPGYKSVVPKYDYSIAAGAVEALQNPNGDVRYQAWTALHAMGEKAEPALLSLYEKSDNPRMRARALWLLGKAEGRGQHFVDLAIKDKEADIRVVGIRLARELKLDLIPIVKQLTADPAPEVRRECAIALRHHESKEAPALWAELALKHDGADRWYLEALGIGADKQWDAYLAAYLEKAGESWNNSAAARDIVWRSRAKQSPTLLVSLIMDPAGTLETIPRYFRAFDFLTGEEKQAALVKLALAPATGNDARDQFISEQSFARLGGVDLSKQPEFASAVEKLLNDSKGKPEFLSLVERFSLEKRYPQLLEIAQAQPEEQLGVDAVRLLLKKDQTALLTGALQDKDPKLAAATIIALGNSTENKAADLLTPLVKDEKLDIALRREATRAMAKIYNGAVRLIKMSEAKELDAKLREAAALPLNTAQWEQVRKFAAKEFPLPAAKDNVQLPPLPQLLAMQGDIERGKKVFETTGTCAKCHIVNGQGKEVGPNLSEIGSKLSRQAFFESILYPSAGISHNYETHTLQLANGTIVTGIITNKTEKEVTIKAADALLRTFPVGEIDEMQKQDISLMPADLQKVLSAQDLADVVDYMQTLKKAVAAAK